MKKYRNFVNKYTGSLYMFKKIAKNILIFMKRINTCINNFTKYDIRSVAHFLLLIASIIR